VSTILYEDEKFLKVCETLICKRDRYAWAFGYPKGWQASMDNSYKPFARDLKLANIKAYNERYQDADEPEDILLDFSKGVLPYTDMEMYVALSSIEYNIDDESVNNCAGILNKLIASLAGDIITRLPEYKSASKVW